MKFLADENVDSAIVERLRKDGHSVLYVLEVSPGISDDEVLKLANQEKALLLTADKDFGEFYFRRGRVAHGVVLIRLAGLSSKQKTEVVVSTVHKHAKELAGNFTVITPEAIRVRKG